MQSKVFPCKIIRIQNWKSFLPLPPTLSCDKEIFPNQTWEEQNKSVSIFNDVNHKKDLTRKEQSNRYKYSFGGLWSPKVSHWKQTILSLFLQEENKWGQWHGTGVISLPPNSPITISRCDKLIWQVLNFNLASLKSRQHLQSCRNPIQSNPIQSFIWAMDFWHNKRKSFSPSGWIRFPLSTGSSSFGVAQGISSTGKCLQLEGISDLLDLQGHFCKLLATEVLFSPFLTLLLCQAVGHHADPGFSYIPHSFPLWEEENNRRKITTGGRSNQAFALLAASALVPPIAGSGDAAPGAERIQERGMLGLSLGLQRCWRNLVPKGWDSFHLPQPSQAGAGDGVWLSRRPLVCRKNRGKELQRCIPPTCLHCLFWEVMNHCLEMPDLLPRATEGDSKRKLESMASLMAEGGRKLHPGPVFDEFHEDCPLKIPALTSHVD